MKALPLTQGKLAAVDSEDFERLSKYNWRYTRHANSAAREVSILGSQKVKVIPIACEVLQTGKRVDHKDCDGLNNQKLNLRICTTSQNAQNSRKATEASSEYKGVWRDEARNKWRSRIMLNGAEYFIGRYKTEVQAAVFYDLAAVHLFKEFARLNFPEHKKFYEKYWKEKEEQEPS